MKIQEITPTTLRLLRNSLEIAMVKCVRETVPRVWSDQLKSTLHSFVTGLCGQMNPTTAMAVLMDFDGYTFKAYRRVNDKTYDIRGMFAFRGDHSFCVHLEVDSIDNNNNKTIVHIMETSIAYVPSFEGRFHCEFCKVTKDKQEEEA